jgi:hypothetical protein
VKRVSMGRLVTLADGMPLHERQIVETVARLSLVSGGQLSQLFFSNISNPSTRARHARRVLGRLVEQRVLDHLERRHGGAGGGSSSWVYALGPAGKRLIAYWAGEGLPRSRSAYEPSTAWTAHTLAVSELYMQLKAVERAGRVEVLAFDAEPACHRHYTRLGGAAGVLKPDAYIRLGVGDWEDSFMLEIDLGSERRGQLSRQHRAYAEHFRSGVEQTKTGIYPGVLWIVPDEKRATLLRDIEQGLPEAVRQLFGVTTFDRAVDLLCGVMDATAGGGIS